MAHAYFRRRNISKSFGGKIKNIYTDVKKNFLLKKSWRMRIIGARFFLSFLAGKLKILTRVTLRVNLGSRDNCIDNI